MGLILEYFTTPKMLTTLLCKHFLSAHWRRNDYIEFLQLSLSFLGSKPAEDTAFCAHGVLHRSGRLSKALRAMTCFITSSISVIVSCEALVIF